ncbi:NB-ARC domain-containing protein [Wolbachia endosymbiont (group B) of Limnophora tigrina]|uniref:NB-ARC domain-containing protein n=1 Tax=Wolbachia endosymbiont (group B) of Limnophora tigrina TaxID=3139317 RepID=UPI0035B52D43
MPETYPTWGLKCFLPGGIYQLKWLMLFLKRGLDREYSFRLNTEVRSAEGFDDIVFQYEQNGTTVHRFIQIKHKQEGTEKISVGSLLTKSSQFNLLKYFVAYLKIKSNGKFKSEIKDFIIATNIDFDFADSTQHAVRKLRMMLSGENKGKEVSVVKIDIQDEFLDIGNGARYRINDSGGSIAQYLEQHMDFIKCEVGREVSNEKIKGFLNELAFVVNLPNDVELERLIKDEISSELARKFKYFDDNEFAYCAFFMMVLSWMKDREGRFLSPKEGREFFQKVELWASTVSEIRQGVERIEGKVDEIGEVLNNQQVRKEPIWFNIKYPVKMFTGRENKLQEMYDKLHESTNKPMAISQIVVICGLGGIGKSELVRKYAYEYRKDYDGNVVWMNAETQGSLEESFKGLARELNKRKGSKVSTTEERNESIIEDVYRYFEDAKGLFIFDNAEGYKNISKFLPSSLNYRPYVLITSRDTK